MKSCDHLYLAVLYEGNRQTSGRVVIVKYQPRPLNSITPINSGKYLTFPKGLQDITSDPPPETLSSLSPVSVLLNTDMTLKKSLVSAPYPGSPRNV